MSCKAKGAIAGVAEMAVRARNALNCNVRSHLVPSPSCPHLSWWGWQPNPPAASLTAQPGLSGLEAGGPYMSCY